MPPENINANQPIIKSKKKLILRIAFIVILAYVITFFGLWFKWYSFISHNPIQTGGSATTTPIINLNVPYSFLAIHEETWDGLEDLMNLATQYNTKVTIMFWPGEVRKVLKDPIKLEKVKQWYLAGNEIGLHNQGCADDPACSGPDLCQQESDKANYEKLAQLIGQDQIKSGTSVCSKWLPDGYVYTVEGRTGGYVPAYSGIDDGRTAKVIVREASTGATGNTIATEDIVGGILYRLNGKAGYGTDKESGTPEKITQYNTLKSTEIYGFILHTYDFQNFGHLPLEQWLQFLYKADPAGSKRKTVRGIMEGYVFPQNLVYNKICGNLICDVSERANNSCPGDCGQCVSGSKPGKISCECDQNENSLDRPCIGNPTQIFLYFSRGILISCGDNKCEEGETSTICPKDCGAAVTKPSTIKTPLPTDKTSVCGDGYCDGPAGEKQTCPADCHL